MYCLQIPYLGETRATTRDPTGVGLEEQEFKTYTDRTDNYYPRHRVEVRDMDRRSPTVVSLHGRDLRV